MTPDMSPAGANLDRRAFQADNDFDAYDQFAQNPENAGKVIVKVHPSLQAEVPIKWEGHSVVFHLKNTPNQSKPIECSSAPHREIVEHFKRQLDAQYGRGFNSTVLSHAQNKEALEKGLSHHIVVSVLEKAKNPSLKDSEDVEKKERSHTAAQELLFEVESNTILVQELSLRVSLCLDKARKNPQQVKQYLSKADQYLAEARETAIKIIDRESEFPQYDPNVDKNRESLYNKLYDHTDRAVHAVMDAKQELRNIQEIQPTDAPVEVKSQEPLFVRHGILEDEVNGGNKSVPVAPELSMVPEEEETEEEETDEEGQTWRNSSKISEEKKRRLLIEKAKVPHQKVMEKLEKQKNHPAKQPDLKRGQTVVPGARI